MRLDRLIAAFLEACARRYQPNTLRGYRYDLARPVRAFPELRARQVKVDHLRAFLDGSEETSAGTVTARRRAALASCFGCGWPAPPRWTRMTSSAIEETRKDGGPLVFARILTMPQHD